MFELSGVNYEEVLEQGDSILVRVIGGSSYRGFALSGLYCIYIYYRITCSTKQTVARVVYLSTKILASQQGVVLQPED